MEQGRCGLRGELPVAKPLLEDLIAAEGVIPNAHGHGGPIGVAVEMDIDTRLTEEGERGLKSERLGRSQRGEFFPLGFGPGTLGSEAATRHDGAALAFVAPARG